MKRPLRIGSRASGLARLQAEQTAAALRQAHRLSGDDIALASLSTKGDEIRSRPLWEMGGKGLFTEAIEKRLLEGGLDMAVHSAKDMPTRRTPGLRADIMLAREEARDALILAPTSDHAPTIAELPPSARVGTCAPRRMAQLLWLRPDIRLIPLRGNVETRLEKLAAGDMDAILLSQAGLQRLAITPPRHALLSPREMLPAAGQGAIAVQYREDDQETRDMLAAIHHFETGLRVAAEKAVLEAIDGSCLTPIGAFAERQGTRLILRARLLSEDGTQRREAHAEAQVSTPADAESLGHRIGAELLTQRPKKRSPCS